jgi:hypothetical protein
MPGPQGRTGLMEYRRDEDALFGLDVGRPDHLRPLFEVSSDARAEFFRTAGDQVKAERRQVFLDVRQRHDLDNLAIEQSDNLLGRSGRNRHGKPRYALDIRIAGFRHCGHIRQRRHPRLTRTYLKIV